MQPSLKTLLQEFFQLVTNAVLVFVRDCILYFIVRDHTEEGLQIAWVLHIRKMSSNVLYINLH